MLSDAVKQAIRDVFKQLKHQLPGYRPRRAQNRMIASVANTLAIDGAAIIEAPTGTGKSMAYLIAGVELARAKERRLIIATATVALQEQLMAQDIPRYLQLADNTTARVALAKGRGRYLCPRNLAHATQGLDETQMGLDLASTTAIWDAPPDAADIGTLQRLQDDFAHEKWDGDLDQAPVDVPSRLRPLVTTTAGGCTGRRCAYFMQCPFFKARRAIEDADIIVANQDLVLSDLTMLNDDNQYGGIILPKPEASFYIIDEGHHLPDKAIRQGARHVYLHLAKQQLSRLGRQAMAVYSLTDKERITRWDIPQAQEKLAELEDTLETLERDIRTHWTPDPQATEPVFRASLGQIPQAWMQTAQVLYKQTSAVLGWLRGMRTQVSELETGGRAREALLRELGMASERMEAQCAAWAAWSVHEAGDALPQARWVSLTRQNHLVCHASRVSAHALLRDVLWDNAAGVILTSATLSAGGNFRDFADAVGLPDTALVQSLPSPFDLATQATLEVPHIKPLPNDREAHAEAVCDWLAHHLNWDEGNLVLFTSRAKLERVLQLLPLDKVRKVQAQGSRSKATLIAQHAKAIEQGNGSTLFGLASFGEGLDLPGKLCQSVVITQLPFAVPTDPIGATYAEWLETCQRNPFFEVALPRATRLLIQYCGRLIRNEDDHGRVVILDPRIVRKSYGHDMLRALPPFARRIEH